MREQLIKALLAHAQGDIQEHVANVEVDLTKEKGEYRWKPVLRTPECKKINIRGVGVRKTAAEAKKFGEQLREEYVKRLEKQAEKPKEVSKEKETAVAPEQAKEPIVAPTDKVEYVKISKATKEPLVDADGDPIQYYGTKAEVDKMIADGTAKYPKDIGPAVSKNITDPNQQPSGLSPSEKRKLNLLVKAEEARKQREYEVDAMSKEVPMTRAEFDAKVETADKIFSIRRDYTAKTPKDIKQAREDYKKLKKSPEYKKMSFEERKLVDLINQNSKIGEFLREVVDKGSEFDKIALVDYAIERLKGNIGRGGS